MPELTKAPENEKFLTDEQLCQKLEISYATLYKHLKEGPPTKRHNVPDIREIEYVVRAGQRRWLETSVNKFLHG